MKTTEELARELEVKIAEVKQRVREAARPVGPLGRLFGIRTNAS